MTNHDFGKQLIIACIVAAIAWWDFFRNVDEARKPNANDEDTARVITSCVTELDKTEKVAKTYIEWSFMPSKQPKRVRRTRLIRESKTWIDKA